MAEEDDVKVEVTVPVDDEENDGAQDAEIGGVATDHAIQGAVDAEVAGQLATAANEDAQAAADVAAGNAELTFSDAQSAAESARIAQETLTQLQLLTQQNAQILAAQAAAQTETNAGELAEVTEETNPSIDVAPESNHWLQKKWFSRKGTD